LDLNTLSHVEKFHQACDAHRPPSPSPCRGAGPYGVMGLRSNSASCLLACSLTAVLRELKPVSLLCAVCELLLIDLHWLLDKGDVLVQTLVSSQRLSARLVSHSVVFFSKKSIKSARFQPSKHDVINYWNGHL
jgi:hypothetical protein